MTALTKVLIVDDELLIRQGIIHYINWGEEGFELIGEASNGKEALTMIAENKPDVIITDMVMPVMSGTEFITKVKALYPEIGIIVLSSYGDYDYVRNTFQSGVTDYILKPKLDSTSLLAALERVIGENERQRRRSSQGAIDQKQLLKTPLKKLLAGYELSEQDKRSLDFFKQDQFALVEVHYSNSIDIEGVIDAVITRVNVINNVILTKTNTSCQLLLNLSSEIFSEFLTLLEKEDSSQQQEKWLISGLFDQLDRLKAINQQQMAMLRSYRFYLKDQTLFYYDHLPKPIIPEESFDLDYFTELLKHKKFESAFYKLDRYIGALQSFYTYDPDQLKSFLGNIIFNTTVLLSMLDYHMDQLEKDKYHYFNTINNATYFDEAIGSFTQYIAAVKAMISGKEKASQTGRIHQLLTYIDEHYSEALSLTSLADHFHFNPSYLSSYFRQHHNVGFSDYLTKVRVDHAKELLGNQELSIAEVGAMVGYTDHSYFCKVFKKNTNKSPSRYRRDAIK
ncbi:response regulator transcription factor [Amphibacillus cookii]|uniref:response regulator transcription factor n=1 Tax=Amphibacillus cookii TaxID=767787 RepID=UPI0019571738|nr:response regulator transcription factor [Amphibacillus cookii]MBM7539869.1 two-component system response regulator YesN [Amphibacillus cookii]